MDNYERLKRYIENKSKDVNRPFAYPGEPIDTTNHESIYKDILKFCEDIENGFIIHRFEDEKIISNQIHRSSNNQFVCYISKTKNDPEVCIQISTEISFGELEVIYDLADTIRRKEFLQSREKSGM